MTADTKLLNSATKKISVELATTVYHVNVIQTVYSIDFEQSLHVV